MQGLLRNLRFLAPALALALVCCTVAFAQDPPPPTLPTLDFDAGAYIDEGAGAIGGVMGKAFGLFLVISAGLVAWVWVRRSRKG
jgi:hypothetical protein